MHQGWKNLNFIFQRVGGSRDLCPGAKSPCHQVTSPGEINILFSLGFSTWSPGLFAPKLRSREGGTLWKMKFNFTRVESLVTSRVFQKDHFSFICKCKPGGHVLVSYQFKNQKIGNLQQKFRDCDTFILYKGKFKKKTKGNLLN